MSEVFGNSSNVRGGILFAFLVALGLYVAWILRDELVLIYVCALLAVVLRPLVRNVSRIRIWKWQPFRGVAIPVMLLVVAGALTALGFYTVPSVIDDLQQFGREVPAQSSGLLAKAQGMPFFDGLNAAAINSKIQDYASHAATYLLITIKDVAGRIATFVAGFILTIYFILEGDTAYGWMISFFPLENRVRLDETLQRARARMGRWLVGQGSLMLVLGLSSTLVFSLLHVRYAYALGIIAGLLNVIPVMGAAISIVLSLLVAAVDSWGKVLGVAIFYLVYIQIENSFLTPHIMRQRVGLPGLGILVALLLGFALAGVMGALVSVPTAVLVAELADEYLVRKVST
ncbi:MAG TPA: AI-2E family transporter [Terracidiphilus sp.]|nr:AI-2E family transporter [Terracidiphilus sp.]